MIEIERGVAQRPCRGETLCGDALFAVEREELFLLAVADGLGHGPHAEAAARAFCDAVRRAEDPRDIEGVLLAADRALVSTRGAAGALLAIDRMTLKLCFAGVGNIEVQAKSRKPVRPVSIAGVLGRRLRKVKTFDFEVSPGDWLAVYSDGISSRFSFAMSLDATKKSSLGRGPSPQQVADRILADHGKTIDDATCVVLHVIESSRSES